MLPRICAVCFVNARAGVRKDRAVEEIATRVEPVSLMLRPGVSGIFPRLRATRHNVQVRGLWFQRLPGRTKGVAGSTGTASYTGIFKKMPHQLLRLSTFVIQRMGCSDVVRAALEDTLFMCVVFGVVVCSVFCQE